MRADEDGVPATGRLLRPYFGMHRFEWPDDDPVEFHLGYGDMLRLLRASGTEVEDLIEVRPPPGSTTPLRWTTLELARKRPHRGGLEGTRARLTSPAARTRRAF